MIATDERISVVLALALAPHGWNLVRLRGRLEDDPKNLVALLAVIEQTDLESFELLARFVCRPHAPPTILLTRMALARALEPVSFRELSASRIMAWPCRPERIAAILAEVVAAATTAPPARRSRVTA